MHFLVCLVSKINKIPFDLFSDIQARKAQYFRNYTNIVFKKPNQTKGTYTVYGKIETLYTLLLSLFPP